LSDDDLDLVAMATTRGVPHTPRLLFALARTKTVGTKLHAMRSVAVPPNEKWSSNKPPVRLNVKSPGKLLITLSTKLAIYFPN